MKQGTKIVLLVAILLLALAITAVKLTFYRDGVFVGLSKFRDIGVSLVSNYDQEGFTVCRTGEERFSAAGVDSLRIDWLSGSVSVERYDGSELIVRETAREAIPEDACLRTRLRNGALEILPCANKVERLPEKQLTVFVPQSLVLSDLDVNASSASVTLLSLETRGAIALDTMSGSHYLENCVCGTLSLDSSSGSQSVLGTVVSGEARSRSMSGSITAESLCCETLDVGSTSGGQRLGALSCQTLTLSSVSGAQHVTELDCREVAATSTSGAVQLAFSAAPERVDVETTSGAVTLAFPKGTGIDLDYSSTSGSLHGSVKRGPIPVRVESTSGSLTVDYR